MRFFTFVIIACLFAFSGQAQTDPSLRLKGIVKGRITSSDGQPAALHTINLKSANRGTLTDETGKFTLKNVPVGPKTLLISLIGHQPEEQSLEVRAGETVATDISLAETAQQLQEVVVAGSSLNRYARNETDYVARMPLKNLENPQVYTVAGKELLKERDVTDFVSAMRSLPGASSASMTA